MIRAIWNDKEIARSDRTVEVEGNPYFPKEDVQMNYLEQSDHRSRCPWKGIAGYYHVVVDGERNENAAWYYPEPFEKAQMIKDRIAFWHGVQIVED